MHPSSSRQSSSDEALADAVLCSEETAPPRIVLARINQPTVKTIEVPSIEKAKNGVLGSHRITRSDVIPGICSKHSLGGILRMGPVKFA